jgi:hypothetical protein|tara:strand:+ start:432 stop:632 length:201 start_codon:yes stop_codon:yes gene_type:complete
MNTEEIKIDNLESSEQKNIYNITQEEFNTIIRDKIKTLDSMLNKKLISIREYNHVKSRIYDLNFDN